MKSWHAVLAFAAAMGIATAASGAEYAPIDCTTANAPDLRAVCKSYALGQAEARMATLFSIVTSLVAMGQRGDLIDTQHDWLKTRAACGSNAACLADTYSARIAQLNAVIAEIASHGPF